ncbi:MAG TPA: glycoside hydrolase family 43 protein, partial [Phycisphaeraceae bacterium]
MTRIAAGCFDAAGADADEDEKEHAMQGQMMVIGGLLAIGLITALMPAALVEAADPMDSTNPTATSPSPAAAETTHTYRNPLGVDIADPDVIFHEGVYYLYGTSAPDGFKVWSSPDLVHWQPRGYAFQRTDTSWGRDLFWAPCIIRHRGAFYLFYSSRGPVGGDQQSLRICVARAEAPTGPFVDVAAPLLDIGKAVIDPHTFIDSDGQAYLYYALDISENGQSQIWAIQLTPDLTAPIGKPVLCLKPSQAWEGKEWNEAPFVFKHGRTYVMMYSARGFFDPRYAVGYATAPSPLGPWT